MANAPNSLRVEILTEDQWARLQLVRLAALQDDPSAFLSNHEKEAMFDEEQWRQEFDRGQWNIMIADEAGEIGLLGVTRETAMSEQECYLEYLWVKRGFRRNGIGTFLLRTVLDRLRDSGIHTVWLYILNGNDTAMRFYQKSGFRRTYERQPLPDHPAGSEERMQLRLA